MQTLRVPGIFERRRLKWLLRLMAYGIGHAVTVLAAAVLIHLTFDRLIFHRHGHPQDWHLLPWIVAGLALSALLSAWLRRSEHSDAERMGQDYVIQMRMLLFDCIRRSAVRSMQRRSRGAVMLRFIGDLNALRRWISLGIARMVVGAVSATIALLALAMANWAMAVSAMAVLAAGMASVFWQGKRMPQAMREARRRRSRLAANVNEKIGSLAVLQVFGRSLGERKRLSRQSRRLRDAMVQQALISGQLRGITEATVSLAAATVLVVGALQVAAGGATPGTVVAAMTIVGLLGHPLRDLGRVYEYWQGAVVARQKVADFVSNPSFIEEVAGAPDLEPSQGTLEFKDVSLDGALRHFSAVAHAGKVIAIVGPNGAGKSSLMMVAARLIDPDDGTVCLDGQCLAAHSLKSVRKAVSMVAPDLPLMRGTVGDNLRYRWPEAPEEEVSRVIGLCRLNEVLKELPDGLATRVSEGGVNLSPGQRQRIALARALLGDPPVLLLDEADANLDPRSNAVIDHVLKSYRGTVLLVTHRWERARTADLLWYIAEGRLMETGIPDELLAGAGVTARLFEKEQRIAC